MPNCRLQDHLDLALQNPSNIVARISVTTSSSENNSEEEGGILI